MKKICDKYANINQPYDMKVVSAVSAIFVIIGFTFLLTYKHAFLRYGIVFAIIVLLISDYKKIKIIIKNLANLKKL